MRSAAFFDMDFTLLDIYTAASHARFLVREGFVQKRDLTRVGIRMGLFRFGMVSDPRPSMWRVARLLEGLDAAVVKRQAEEWVESDLSGHLRPAALTHLDGHRRQGDVLVLMTSSLSCPAEQLAAYLDIPFVVSNVLEIGSDGRYTGQLSGPVCFGETKSQCLDEFTTQNDVDPGISTFYTDSHHDIPVLREFGDPRPVNPDRILKAEALKNGWPVLLW